MYKIGTYGERTSDKIIRQFTAEILDIPETEEDARKVEAMCGSCDHEKKATDCDCGEADCDCGDNGDKDASSCPQCGNQMQKSGNLERCACGYATASAEFVEEKKQATQKSAGETSIADYYKKIFPDDYVADLTGDVDTPAAGKSVEYGYSSSKEEVNTPPAGNDVKYAPTANRVTVRELLANDYPDCSVEDDHPESGVGAGSGATDTPDPKWQKGDSANSVSGPEKAKSHGPGSGGDFPTGPAPDLGQGKHKARRRLTAHPAGSPTRLDDPKPESGVNSGSAQANPEVNVQRDDSANSVNGPDDANSHGAGGGTDFPDKQAPDLGLPSQHGAGRNYLSREVVARWSPKLAKRMQSLRIKGVSTQFVARALSKAIEEKTGN